MFAVVVLFLVALAAGALGGLVGHRILAGAATGTRRGLRTSCSRPCHGRRGSVGQRCPCVAAWWREIHWRAVVAYALPGTPAAVLGAHTLLTIPQTVVDGLLGVFFWR